MSRRELKLFEGHHLFANTALLFVLAIIIQRKNRLLLEFLDVIFMGKYFTANARLSNTSNIDLNQRRIKDGDISLFQGLGQ